jgi:hypothetical protein
VKTYSKQEVTDHIEKLVANTNPDYWSMDNDGQLIVYIGIYRWSTGTYHDEPEP